MIIIIEDTESDFEKIQVILEKLDYKSYPDDPVSFRKFRSLYRDLLSYNKQDNSEQKLLTEINKSFPIKLFIVDSNLMDTAMGDEKGGELRQHFIKKYFPFVPCLFFSRYNKTVHQKFMEPFDHAEWKGNHAEFLKIEYWNDDLHNFFRKIKFNNEE